MLLINSYLRFQFHSFYQLSLHTMESCKLLKQENNMVLILSLLLLILLPLTPLRSQTPADYSGKWAFDLSKSNLGEGENTGLEMKFLI